MIHYEKVVYISHPYGGRDSNKQDIENAILRLNKLYPTYLFLSPVNTFGFEYYECSYEDGIKKCLWLLDRCDEMWVFGDDYEQSRGCMTEIQYCRDNNIPYVIK